MKFKNKMISCMLITVLCLSALAGCGSKSTSKSENNQNQIKVVATIFPVYDFLRVIGGDKIDLKMLLTPGAETHSFEPTPQNIKDVDHADLFAYIGGDSDSWVETIMESVDRNKMKVVTFMDCVDLVEEELKEGMTPEEDHDHEEHSDVDHNLEEGKEEIEYDEHVWTSPRNAILIVQRLCDALSEIDAANASYYQENTTKYIGQLTDLDQEFKDVVNNAKRHEIIVGDRFPFRYFADAYGLDYYAAFPGCSTDSEPSAATIAFLTDKVKEDKIPVIFHLELSNHKVADSISEATGAKSMQLNAVHNITKADFDNGASYLSMMKENVTVLKEALN